MVEQKPPTDLMAQDIEGQKESWLVPIAFGAGLCALGGLGWYLTQSPLWSCDKAIMETLKAPSTYRRVESSGTAGFYSIEYDAENSFGVPLRNKGYCSIDSSGAATWRETP